MHRNSSHEERRNPAEGSDDDALRRLVMCALRRSPCLMDMSHGILDDVKDLRSNVEEDR